MFIGMLNFADDNGNLSYSAKRLKMQIFPADMIDTQPLLDELLIHGVLIEYSVNGEKFINIKGFRKHQLINRPSASKIPGLEFNDDSVSTRGMLTDGVEGKGREGIKEVPNGTLSPAKLPTCPTQAIVDMYHEVLPELPTVRLMDDKRKRAIAGLWRFALTSKKPDGQPRAQDAEEAKVWTRQFFERARVNDFLMGRNAREGAHANWKCDLDFLLTDKGMKHVIEKTRDNG